MGIRRKELRQAVVHILGRSGLPPFPTNAGNRVYDSKQDALQDVAGQSQMPAILVYTDNQMGKPIALNNWPMDMTVELVIELAMGADAASIDTDSKLEAGLDDLEDQVLSALFEAKPDSNAARFSNMYTKLLEYKSLRMGNTENNNRLAMRSIVLDFAINSRCSDLAAAFPELASINMITDVGDEGNDALNVEVSATTNS